MPQRRVMEARTYSFRPLHQNMPAVRQANGDIEDIQITDRKSTHNVLTCAKNYVLESHSITYAVGLPLLWIPSQLHRVLLLWQYLKLEGRVLTLDQLLASPVLILTAPYIAWADAMRFGDRYLGDSTSLSSSIVSFFVGSSSLFYTMPYNLLSVSLAASLNIIEAAYTDLYNAVVGGVNFFISKEDQVVIPNFRLN
jgi:hypothetical protein